LHVSNSDARIRIQDSDGTNTYGEIKHTTGALYLSSRVNTSNGVIVFNRDNGTTTTESMRIDSSGNLLVGTIVLTDIDSSGTGNEGAFIQSYGHLGIAVSNGECATFNRKTADGDIIDFRYNGSPVGSIGSEAGSYLYIGHDYTGIYFRTDDTSIRPFYPVTNAESDGIINLGSSGARFDDIYAVNGTIQTSDRNEKQDIEALSEAEQRVAVAAKGLLRKFRWKSSVEEKGDDARTHFGIIAQDLQAAFEAEGLDAKRYAMFIHSTWTDEETGEERSRMGVRYSELLAFIISAI
jgi:hypothetical protein